MNSRGRRALMTTAGCLLVCALVVLGTPVPQASAQEAWLNLLNEYKTSTKQNRMLIAKGLLEEVYEPIDALVPNLKPGEKEWMDKEKRDLEVLRKSPAQADAYVQKSRALLNTAEYHIHTLKERLNEIETPLRNIARRGKSLTLQEEITAWAEVVYWITYDPSEFNVNFAFLEKEKKVTTNNMKGLVRYGAAGDYWYHQTRYANTIQGAIVVQYLQGEIKK